MTAIDDINSHILENYGEEIEGTLAESESIEDFVEAARILSLERADARSASAVTDEDIEKVLEKLCALPLMPKDDEKVHAVRKPLFKNAAEYNALPVDVTDSILLDSQTDLTDFRVSNYNSSEKIIISIRDIIEEMGLDKTQEYLENSHQKFYENQLTYETEYETDVLVSAGWVEDQLDEFESDDPDKRLVEVDVDTEAYDDAHAPGAIGFNWETDLQDQTTRDILSKDDFENLLGSHGITEDSTVVLYGDNSNWFAAYTYWQFKYYGHDDVRLMDGGREYWIENDYPTTDEVPEFSAVDYEASGPRESIRAYREDVEHAINRNLPLVDVRSPQEFRGEILAPPGLNETAQRGGHIPGAKNISWAAVTNDDGTFRSREELQQLFAEYGIDGDETTVAYCRIGERSSVAWFALHELLGYEDTINYDGSWTEWGNLVGVPIEKGDADNS